MRNLLNRTYSYDFKCVATLMQNTRFSVRNSAFGLRIFLYTFMQTDSICLFDVIKCLKYGMEGV